MAREKINIEDLKTHDKEAAIEYNQIIDKLENEIKVERVLTNGNRINLMGFFKSPHVQRSIKGLSEDEISLIEQDFKQVQDLKARMGVLKRKAFKIHGTDKLGSSMLEPIKSTLYDMMGSLHSNEEISKKLKADGMHVSEGQLERFRIKHREPIKKLQDEYEQEWHTVGISRKRARLDQLANMYGKYKTNFDKAEGRDLNTGKEMVKVLEQVRKEVEGDQIKINVHGQIDISTTIEMNQSVEQLYANINFMNLLIGRAAARLKVNPIELHYRLTNSWYSKFTGMRRNPGMSDDQAPYPSSIIYDWSEIEGAYDIQERKISEIAPTHEEVEITEIISPAKRSLKEILEEKQKMME